MSTIAKTPSDIINSLFEKEQWKIAQSYIEKQLFTMIPSDISRHWWMARLATALYEQRNYTAAGIYARRALKISRNCPLALWELAGVNDMIGREEEAIIIYKKIIRLGEASWPEEVCWEGIEKKKSLIADCKYRISKCYNYLGDTTRAELYSRDYADDVKSGSESIYVHHFASHERIDSAINTTKHISIGDFYPAIQQQPEMLFLSATTSADDSPMPTFCNPPSPTVAFSSLGHRLTSRIVRTSLESQKSEIFST